MKNLSRLLIALVFLGLAGFMLDMATTNRSNNSTATTPLLVSAPTVTPTPTALPTNPPTDTSTPTLQETRPLQIPTQTASTTNKSLATFNGINDDVLSVQTVFTYQKTPIVKEDVYTLQLNAMDLNNNWWQDVLEVFSNSSALWCMEEWNISSGIITNGFQATLPLNITSYLVNLGQNTNDSVTLSLTQNTASINITSNGTAIYSDNYPISVNSSFLDIQPCIVGGSGGQTAFFTTGSFNVDTSASCPLQDALAPRLTAENSNLVETQIQGEDFVYAP